MHPNRSIQHSYTKTGKHESEGQRDIRVNHIKVIERQGLKKVLKYCKGIM